MFVSLPSPYSNSLRAPCLTYVGRERASHDWLRLLQEPLLSKLPTIDRDTDVQRLVAGEALGYSSFDFCIGHFCQQGRASEGSGSLGFFRVPSRGTSTSMAALMRDCSGGFSLEPSFGSSLFWQFRSSSRSSVPPFQLDLGYPLESPSNETYRRYRENVKTFI